MSKNVSIRCSFGFSEGDPYNVGHYWVFMGDSHTAGRASGTAKNPQLAFHYIWVDSFPTSASGLGAVEPTNNGVSGRRLLGTSAWYMASTSNMPYRSWCHFQESGDQVQGTPSDGQSTSADFAYNFELFVRSIVARSTSAFISTETAFNFGRGPENENDAGRDWGPYNIAMLQKIASLSAEGIIVRVSQTDRNIKALDTLMGLSYTTTSAWYPQGNANEYHFTEIGNLMIALGHYKMLGHNVNALNLNSISAVSSVVKAQCLEVINSFG